MQKIKNIVYQSLKFGFVEESESILSDLVDAQCQEMGLLHDETLDTIQLWAHTLALLGRWDNLDEVLELLESAQRSVKDAGLAHTINTISQMTNAETNTLNMVTV